MPILPLSVSQQQNPVTPFTEMSVVLDTDSTGLRPTILAPFFIPPAIYQNGANALSERIVVIIRSALNSPFLTDDERQYFHKLSLSETCIIHYPSLFLPLLAAAYDLSLVTLFWAGTNGGPDLSQAETLSAKATSIRQWLKEGGGSNIDSITCNDKGVTCIPEELRLITGLKRLELSNNHIEVIPDFFGDLELNVLDLHYNRIRLIPGALDHHQETLQSLILSNTAIECIPYFIGNFKKLHSLDALNCRIRFVSDNVLNLQKHTLQILGNRTFPINIYSSDGTILFTGNDSEVSAWLESQLPNT